MGLARPVLELLVHQHGVYRFQGPGVTLGVQDIVVRRSELSDWLRGGGMPTDSKGLDRLACADAQGFVTSPELFAAMGIDGHETLDKFGDEGASILHDLCEPVPEGLRGAFGLVIDGGSLEHVFDTRAAFRNMIDLCRVGGVAVHVSPLAGWDNHGFYSFHPKLMFELYAANGFDDHRCFLVHEDRDRHPFEGWAEPCPTVHAPLRLDGHGEHVFLVYLARKARHLPDFVVPVDTHQGTDHRAVVQNAASEDELPPGLRRPEPPKAATPGFWARLFRARASSDR